MLSMIRNTTSRKEDNMERKFKETIKHTFSDGEVTDVTVFECGCKESKYHIEACKEHEHLYTSECDCDLCKR